MELLEESTMTKLWTITPRIMPSESERNLPICILPTLLVIAIPVAGVSIESDSKKSHKRLKKPSNIDNSLYPLFQTLIFGLCYCFLRLYIPTDNEGEWSNDRNRDFFCQPKVVTFPYFQKQWLLCYQKTGRFSHFLIPRSSSLIPLRFTQYEATLYYQGLIRELLVVRS